MNSDRHEMACEVATTCDSQRDTLGPFNSLQDAEATVTRLASEAVGRQRFGAYVVLLPDDTGQPQPTGT